LIVFILNINIISKIKMDSVSFRGFTKGGNHRNLLMRTDTLIQDGSMSTGCPTGLRVPGKNEAVSLEQRVKNLIYPVRKDGTF
jgi:hypothetical protein